MCLIFCSRELAKLGDACHIFGTSMIYLQINYSSFQAENNIVESNFNDREIKFLVFEKSFKTLSIDN